MKIECVITCKDYADFLAHTLPENLQHLDRVVVITHPKDKATQSVCNLFGVECVQTTSFEENGDTFNKGRGINIGLGHLRGADWILHMDADIVLPHRFRDLLSRHFLDPKNIYGADRLNVFGHEHWEKNKKKLIPHYSSKYFIEPITEFKFGARIVHWEHGYVPIGYFQLWNQSVKKRYPVHQGNAEHTDVLFAIQWARENRILLPEVLVYHLESDDSQIMGANWNGRVTKPFCKCHKHFHVHQCHPRPYCNPKHHV